MRVFATVVRLGRRALFRLPYPLISCPLPSPGCCWWEVRKHQPSVLTRAQISRKRSWQTRQNMVSCITMWYIVSLY